MSVLTSRQNPLCAHVRKLCAQSRYRREAGEYLADGRKLWEEAVRWRAPIRRLITTPETQVERPRGVEHTEVSGELMAYLSPMESPQGLLFTLAIPEKTPPVLEGKRYLVLDGLQDPGNVGTIWRTADALGADGLFLLNHCADPYGPKTVRAAMGASFRLPAWEITLEELRELLQEAGIPLYAAALGTNSIDITKAGLGSCAMVVGNEGHGVSREVLDACDGQVIIPMRPRCESLNAATAAAILLWEMGRSERGS